MNWKKQNRLEFLKNMNKEWLLVIISVFIYSITLLIHFIYTKYINPDYSLLISDQIKFFNRGNSILIGLIPYKDFQVDAAALSPYLWSPVILTSMFITGDFTYETITEANYLSFESMIFSSYLFRIFFSICLIISAVILYRLEEKRQKTKAFLISLLYVLNPFFLYLVSFWGSDECIVPLLILLPIYFFEKEKNVLAIAFIILGTGLKYFPILLCPLIWIYGKNWKERIIHSFIFLLFLLTISLPFYLIAPEEYLLQFENPITAPVNQGLFTLIQAFVSINLDDYNLIFQIAALGTILTSGLYLFLKREKWSYQRTIVLFALFLLLYPKIQLSYFVIVIPFLYSLFFKQKRGKWLNLIYFFSGVFSGMASIYIIYTPDVSSIIRILSWTNLAIYYTTTIITIILYLFTRRNFDLFISDN